MSEFTTNLRELMLRDKITQKDLAILSGISESSICRYLSGTLQPRIDILAKISKVFKVSTSFLMGDERNEFLPQNAFEETLCVVTRNKTKLNDQQKAELVKILFGGK